MHREVDRESTAQGVCYRVLDSGAELKDKLATGPPSELCLCNCDGEGAVVG